MFRADGSRQDVARWHYEGVQFELTLQQDSFMPRIAP